MLGLMCLTGQHRDFPLVDVEPAGRKVFDSYFVGGCGQERVSSNDESLLTRQGHIPGNGIVDEIGFGRAEFDDYRIARPR